jgi:enamine deaminase RidA (YjgF/YER057c/UK114 family)
VATDLRPVPVNPASLPTPSGYSHGTLSGNTLYLGGQTALDAQMRIVPGGIVAQFRQAFGNVLTRRTAARSAPSGASSPAPATPRWPASAPRRSGSPRR